jgi:nicotinamide riboside kinase
VTLKMNPTATVLTLLGAESTGKSTLSVALVQALQARGLTATLVPEYLREFCELKGRTPQPHEQWHIAQEQTRRIDEAAQSSRVVVADTNALMTAVYSDLVFADRSLYAFALDQATQAAGMTLLTALDLPWQADGFQREGPQVRGPVDALLRLALQRAGLAYNVVSGQGEARLHNALRCVNGAWGHALGYCI